MKNIINNLDCPSTVSFMTMFEELTNLKKEKRHLEILHHFELTFHSTMEYWKILLETKQKV
jgi:hypothetical protein